ncbi:MAG: cupin domain-containing protein [Sulfuritalea sp.]|nr:cupin domain-containing protein [Sulfuritalea sp.]
MNPATTRSGAHFSLAELGRMEQWKSHTAEIAAMPGIKVPGKCFLHPLLGLTGMEISVNCLPAGAKVPFSHTHREHEELYLFLRGRGQFQVDGEVIEINEGTALRVAPEGSRTWRNNSTEDLYYLVIQATAGSLKTPGSDDGLPQPGRPVWPA